MVTRVGICSLLNDNDIEIEKEVFSDTDFELVREPYGPEHTFQEGKRDDFLASVDGLIMANTLVDRDVAKRMSRCKVIARHGQGVDNLDLEACADEGIQVCNMAAFGVDEVSDHAVMFAMILLKQFHTYYLDVRKGNWNVEKVPAWDLKKIGAATLGLVGFGRIGQETARKAYQMFGRIVAHDPCMDKEKAEALGVETVDSLDEVLGRSDVVSVHIPLNKHTRGFFDKSLFAKMKPEAYLVNTSRGPIVNGRDLYEALITGQLAGAALDVMEQEPANMDDPLFSLENVVFTPHSAFRSDKSLPELRRHCAMEVKRVLTGQPPASPANSPDEKKRS
ncbi:MAG: C-terminal binding protein [Synergistales bacterium]|nr:C-terminal binding protein [Synergistales bacterium]